MVVPNIFPDRKVTALEYQTKGTSQNETLVNFVATANATWETAYTVPAGKTFYLTKVLLTNISNANARLLQFGTSTIQPILLEDVAISSTSGYDFLIPIKFTTGTILQLKAENGAASDESITLIGWEE